MFELLADGVSVGAPESEGIVEVTVEVTEGSTEASSSRRILLDQREAINELAESEVFTDRLLTERNTDKGLCLGHPHVSVSNCVCLDQGP